MELRSSLSVLLTFAKERMPSPLWGLFEAMSGMIAENV